MAPFSFANLTIYPTWSSIPGLGIYSGFGHLFWAWRHPCNPWQIKRRKIFVSVPFTPKKSAFDKDIHFGSGFW